MTETQAAPTASPEERRLTGIQGWLYLYVFLNGVLSPLLVYSTRANVVTTYIGYVRWGLTALGLLTVVLLYLRSNFALRLIPVYLALFGADILYFAYWTITNMSGAGRTVELIKLAINLAVNIAWYLYFKRSRRVRYTLGRNLR